MTYGPVKYLAELAPVPRLLMDEKPPIATKIWLITKYGNGYAGMYDKNDPTIVAWCPLPKLSPDDKRRLMAAEAAGLDLTQLNGEPRGTEPPDERDGAGQCCARGNDLPGGALSPGDERG